MTSEGWECLGTLIKSSGCRLRKLELKITKTDDDTIKVRREILLEELRGTTMAAGSRTLLQVTVEQAALADEVMGVLMGDDVESRKHFIQTNAKDVRFLDI